MSFPKIRKKVSERKKEETCVYEFKWKVLYKQSKVGYVQNPSSERLRNSKYVSNKESGVCAYLRYYGPHESPSQHDGDEDSQVAVHPVKVL